MTIGDLPSSGRRTPSSDIVDFSCGYSRSDSNNAQNYANISRNYSNVGQRKSLKFLEASQKAADYPICDSTLFSMLKNYKKYLSQSEADIMRIMPKRVNSVKCGLDSTASGKDRLKRHSSLAAGFAVPNFYCNLCHKNFSNQPTQIKISCPRGRLVDVEFYEEKRHKTRYLYAHDEFLCIAKKSKHGTYFVKERIFFHEIWIHTVDSQFAVDEENIEKKSVVIGWALKYHVIKFRDSSISKTWCTFLTHEISKRRKEFTHGLVPPVKISFQEESLSIAKKIMPQKNQNVSNLVDEFLNKIRSADKSNYEIYAEYGKYQKMHKLLGIENPIALSVSHCKNVLTSQSRSEKMRKNRPINEEQFLCTLNFTVKLRPKTRSKSFSTFDKAMNFPPASKSFSNVLTYCRPSTRRNDVSKNFACKPFDSASQKIFGQRLEKLSSNGFDLPVKLKGLMLEIYEKGVVSDGIFRKSPNQREFKEAKRIFDSDVDADAPSAWHPNICASLLKEFLRCLPGSLVTMKQLPHWLNLSREKENRSMILQAKNIVSRTPYLHRVLLQDLMCLLRHVTDYERINRMNAKNLSICLAPSLFSLCQTDSLANNEDSIKVSAVTQFLIENFQEIFGFGNASFFRRSEKYDAASTPSTESVDESDSSTFHRVEDTGSLDSVFDDSLNGFSVGSPPCPRARTPFYPKARTPAISRDSGLYDSQERMLADYHMFLKTVKFCSDHVDV